MWLGSRVVAAQQIHKRGAASWAPAERKLWRHMSTVRRASALGARASPSQLGGALLECKLVATASTRVLRVSMVAAWPAHLRVSVMQGKLRAERGCIARKSKCVRGRASRTCACCVRTALAGARVRVGCSWQGEIPVVERELACGRHSCGRATRLSARCLREQCSCMAASNGGCVAPTHHDARVRARRMRGRLKRAKRSGGCFTHLLDWG